MFIKELAFIINSSCCFSEGGKGGILGGGGGYWPFHTSRIMNSAFQVSREKNNSYDQFFLLWLRTTAKELACSMSSPFSRFLFLVLWKRNRVLCLEVEARHHLLLIQNHCHQRSRHSIWSKTNGERVRIQSNFVAINRPEFVGNQRVHYFKFGPSDNTFNASGLVNLMIGSIAILSLFCKSSLAKSFQSWDLIEGSLISRSVCITASDKRLPSKRQNQLLKLHLQLFPTCTASGR